MHQAAGEANESLANYDARPRRVPEGARPRPGPARDPLPRWGGCSWRGRGHPARRPTPRRTPRCEFEQELRLDPTNADAAYELGEIRRKAGDLDKARELFELAVKSYPDFEQGLVGLGRVLVSQGKADLALPPLAKAVSLNPENDVAYFQLWQAHRALGHRAGAGEGTGRVPAPARPEARAGTAGHAPPARGHAAGAGRADGAALGFGESSPQRDERFHEEPNMSTTRPRSGLAPALALSRRDPLAAGGRRHRTCSRPRRETPLEGGEPAHGVQGEPARHRRSQARG